MSSDDGVRLYLNGDLVIDQWQGRPVTTFYQFNNLESGTWYYSVQVVDINGPVSEPSALVEYNIP